MPLRQQQSRSAETRRNVVFVIIGGTLTGVWNVVLRIFTKSHMCRQATGARGAAMKKAGPLAKCRLLAATDWT
ncbi:hypothetical protein A9Y76_04520 [Ralstonia insidiosa]|uniref:Uncharacterized protein n=1 Tax=Ralstonia insidiosa TaxID=190721 RepID=A0A191ZUL1_9RALS|nr:hypothetical protein A9Y76_04520 [Ralstonia insidiosa]